MSVIKNILFIFIFSLTTLMSTESSRIMLLGDSITYDWAFSDMTDPRPENVRSGYRNYLWYMLQNAAYNVDFIGSHVAGTAIVPSFDPHNEGYTGWTTWQISDIIYNRLIANPADIILLHIGTNDWSENTSGVNHILDEIDRYEQNYDHSIKVVLARIINSPLNYAHLHNYNINLQSLADSRIKGGDDIVVVDMEYGADINYGKDFQDSFHPNNTGYYKMAEVWFNSLNTILPTLIPPNPLIRPFVEHFYTKILLREGEEPGIAYWSEKLATHELTAADLARGFIFSDEFENQSTDDITFLEILYSAFFDRVPDSSGLAYWEDQLNQGKSRFSVLNGFLYSQEFNSLAQSYNILAVDP